MVEACTSFGVEATPSVEDAASPDPSAADAARLDGSGEALSVAIADIDQPTTLLRDRDRLYIAANNGVHRWPIIGDAGAVRLNDLARVNSVVPVVGDALMVHHGTSLSFFDSREVDASVAVTPCSANGAVQALAVFASTVFYGTTTEFRRTYNMTECKSFSVSVLDAGAPARPTPLLFADGAALYRYAVAGSSGSIVACTDPMDCGGTTTTIVANVWDVEAMIVDEENVYWATSTSVFSAPKTGVGEPVLLADGQGLPRALATGAGAVFWTNYEGGTVMTASPGQRGTARVLRADLQKPWGIVVTGQEVFVAESALNRVVRFPRP